MKHSTQIALLEELLELHARKMPFLDGDVATSPVERYRQADRFERECREVFQALPAMAAHVSELPDAGAYVLRELSGMPLLIVRGEDGQVRAFVNVCRHRGTRLVDEPAGCARRFSCRYHGWTWRNDGQFVGAPHLDSGFPGLDHSAVGLRAVAVTEHHGFIWLLPDRCTVGVEDFLGGLDEDLAWVFDAPLEVKGCDTQVRHANWKLIAEGGLEAYHFRVAHRATIAPLFHDNLSSYQVFGHHMRTILPRITLPQLRETPQAQWDIRAHANLLYSIFPGSSLLVQQDHVVWIQSEALAVDRTALRLLTLGPVGDGRPAGYWQKNHQLTVMTLNEDFDIAESIQQGLGSGANESFRFGRFEGALDRFNRIVDAALDDRP